MFYKMIQKVGVALRSKVEKMIYDMQTNILLLTLQWIIYIRCQIRDIKVVAAAWWFNEVYNDSVLLMLPCASRTDYQIQRLKCLCVHVITRKGSHWFVQ